jgi:hypothetical protein
MGREGGREEKAGASAMARGRARKGGEVGLVRC